MATQGYHYWALVAMAIALPVVSTAGFWFTASWVPGLPRSRAGVRSLMGFGGTVTLNCLLVYIANNTEKTLLGRFWGAEALGIYGRAYQITNIPTDNINAAVGEVAFSALSRIQDDPARVRSYFLKGYSLVLALTVPITMALGLFSSDLILVLLGPKWRDAAPICRLLAPTILIFALINPLGWLLFSQGMVRRGLKIASVLTPLVITAYLAGLPYGPKAVAFTYSAVMMVWVVPHIAWSVHGTAISLRDVLRTASRPLISGIVAALAAFALERLSAQAFSPLGRLLIGSTVLGGIYIWMLLCAMRQKAFYADLVRGMRERAPLPSQPLVAG